MAVKVILGNRSQETGKLSSNGTDDSIKVSRSVYQALRSLTKNKTIVADVAADKVPKELIALYEDFDKINNGKEVEDYIKKLDEYFGSLGITQEYEYSKDIIDIEPWIAVETQDPTRNVIAEVEGVIYNVIAEEGGIDYNVAHDTINQTIGVLNAK